MKKKSKILKMKYKKKNRMTNILNKCSPITKILTFQSKMISKSNKTLSTKLSILTWRIKMKQKLKKLGKLKLILRFVHFLKENLRAQLLLHTKIQKIKCYHSKEWEYLIKENCTMLLLYVLINQKDKDINLAKC